MRHEPKREAAILANKKMQRIAEYEKDVEMEMEKKEADKNLAEDVGKQGGNSMAQKPFEQLFG